jgi:hypothetical protein
VTRCGLTQKLAVVFANHCWSPTRDSVDENHARRTTVSRKSLARATTPSTRATLTGSLVDCELHDSVITLSSVCSFRH